MALGIGIVGLPNVGKSTTFNALTQTQNAEAANYPFCTIEPNKAIVLVPDPRLDTICEIAQPKKVVPTTLEFCDIAGLVKGASKGEGLGNQFLGNIREVDAIIHVVRCFDDENIIHSQGNVDPLEDMAIIDTELVLADYEMLDRRLEKLRKQGRGDKALSATIEVAEALLAHLATDQFALTFPDRESDHYKELDKELRFITGKTEILVANVDEDGLESDSPYVEAVRQRGKDRGCEVVKLCAKVEEEMAGMSDEERHEFLASLGAEESGLDQLIRLGYQALGLVTYFTAGPQECRAWTIHEGDKAPQAAGVIHTDFERGFIRAEVITYDDFVEQGGEQGAKTAGVMRTEGKDYTVQDGDVIHFLFNV
jgi:GTP-binding protein YchF